MNYQEVLFIADKHGHTTHAVVPIDIYNSLLALKGLLAESTAKNPHEIYTLSIKHVIARGYPAGIRTKPKFVIIKGSQATTNLAGSVPDHVKSLREQLLREQILIPSAERRHLIFAKDLTLQSPSLAAAVVAGNVRNGLDVWLSREGFSLKQSGYGVKKRGKRVV